MVVRSKTGNYPSCECRGTGPVGKPLLSVSTVEKPENRP